MKKPCSITIVTNQLENRYEVTIIGDIDFSDSVVYIGYTDSEAAVTIGVSKKMATITRRNADGYTLIAEEGELHDFILAGQNFAVSTKKVLAKKSANSYDLYLVFSLLLGTQCVENKVFVKCRF